MIKILEELLDEFNVDGFDDLGVSYKVGDKYSIGINDTNRSYLFFSVDPKVRFTKQNAVSSCSNNYHMDFAVNLLLHKQTSNNVNLLAKGFSSISSFNPKESDVIRLTNLQMVGANIDSSELYKKYNGTKKEINGVIEISFLMSVKINKCTDIPLC